MKVRSQPVRLRQNVYRIFLGLVLFSLIGTILSSKLHVEAGFIAPLCALLVIILGSVGVSMEFGNWRGSVLFGVLTGLSEVVGIYTGFPFGKYAYTGKWWPSIVFDSTHSFPVLLPFAWILVSAGSYLTVREHLNGRWAIPLAGLLAAVIDAPMERSMTQSFGYWTWKESGPVFGVPVMNAFGWALVTIVALVATHRLHSDTKPELASRFLAAFCAFVALEGLVHRVDLAYLLLALIGLGIYISSQFAQRMQP